MSKLTITYDASNEIEEIIKLVEQHVDCKKEEKEIYDHIQKMFQSCFEEGRKFQKQLNVSSNVKDGILIKAEI